MDSFDIISYSSITKCRVQCHSSKWYNFYYSFLFSLKNVFFLQPQWAKTLIKNRGRRSRFMAKIQQTAQFRLQMIILRKGTGTIFKIGTFLAGRIINQLEYKKGLCYLGLSLGDWSKLSFIWPNLFKFQSLSIFAIRWTARHGTVSMPKYTPAQITKLGHFFPNSIEAENVLAF